MTEKESRAWHNAISAKFGETPMTDEEWAHRNDNAILEDPGDESEQLPSDRSMDIADEIPRGCDQLPSLSRLRSLSLPMSQRSEDEESLVGTVRVSQEEFLELTEARGILESMRKKRPDLVPALRAAAPVPGPRPPVPGCFRRCRGPGAGAGAGGRGLGLDLTIFSTSTFFIFQ